MQVVATLVGMYFEPLDAECAGVVWASLEGCGDARGGEPMKMMKLDDIHDYGNKP